jgi:hypothetical protein
VSLRVGRNSNPRDNIDRSLISPTTLFKIGTGCPVSAAILHIYLAFEKNTSATIGGAGVENRYFFWVFCLPVSHVGLNLAGLKG